MLDGTTQTESMNSIPEDAAPAGAADGAPTVATIPEGANPPDESHLQALNPPPRRVPHEPTRVQPMRNAPLPKRYLRRGKASRGGNGDVWAHSIRLQ